MSNNAADWYWSGTPGLYGSKRVGLVDGDPSADSDYSAWLAQGRLPTPWPMDGSGTQTTAALDEVLISAGQPPSVRAIRLLAYANAKVSGLRAVAKSYDLGGVSVLADALTDTVALVSGLADWGIAEPAATQQWIDNFGTTTTITGAQAVTLKQAGLAYLQSVFAVLATAATSIGSSAITTKAEIDALAWPT